MTEKPWWKSKTYWFNILSGIGLIGTEMGAVLALYPHENETVILIQTWLPIFNAAVNLWLRSITHMPVKL